MTCEEVTRLIILISRVESLCKSEAGSISTSHRRSSRPYLDASLISNPVREPLIGISPFHHETANARSLSTYASRFQTPIRHRLTWNFFCHRGGDSLLEVKVVQFILSHATFLVLLLLDEDTSCNSFPPRRINVLHF